MWLLWRELLLSLWLLSSLVLAASNGTLLGSTTAKCSAGFEWELNKNGQTPCAVVASLLSACEGAAVELPGIPSGNNAYPGPTSTANTTANHGLNRCLCSVPVYALLSSCADCQGAKFPDFKTHTESCNRSFTGDGLGAVHALPAAADAAVRNGTVVPPWALHNWAKAAGGTFNPTQAERLAIANQSFPASDAAAVSSQWVSSTGNTVLPSASRGSITPIKATAGTAVPTSSPNSTAAADTSGASASGGGSNAGAIAGGTVGGVAIVSVTIIAMYWLLLKTRDSRRPFSGGVVVPGGGGAAMRVGSRDDAGAPPEHPPYSGGGGAASSMCNGRAPPAHPPGPHPERMDVGSLQRQASQWDRGYPGGHARAPDGSFPQAGYAFPQPPPMQQASSAAPTPFPAVGLATVSDAGHSYSHSTHSHTPPTIHVPSAAVAPASSSAARPHIAVQTSGYGGAASKPSPQKGSASCAVRNAFRALKAGSPGGLRMDQAASPAGPRPMMNQRSNQGVTIVNMDRPFAAYSQPLSAQSQSPSRALPRPPLQHQVSGPSAVLLGPHRTLPEP